MTPKLKISLAIGMALSAVALYVAIGQVPFADLFAYLGSINWWWTLPSAAAAMVSVGLRVWRWQIMLGLEGATGFRMAWHPVMIGFFINVVLPGRLGEMARPALIDRRAGIAFSRGLATVIAERLMDLAILILLFSLVAHTVAIDPYLDIPFGNYHLNKSTLMGIANKMVFISAALLVFILALGIDRSRRAIVKTVTAIADAMARTKVPAGRWIQTAVAGWFVRAIENIGSGFGLIKSPARLLACTVLGIVVWLVNVGSFYLLALGCPGIEMGVAEAMAYMVILCFFIALPSAPGYWGLWEAGGVFALALFGVPTRDAVGYTLTAHVVQILLTMVLGLVSSLITGVNILSMLKPSPIDPKAHAPLSGRDV